MSDDSSNRTDVSTIHLDNISLQNRENVDDDNNSKFIGFDLSTQQVSARRQSIRAQVRSVRQLSSKLIARTHLHLHLPQLQQQQQHRS